MECRCCEPLFFCVFKEEKEEDKSNGEEEEVERKKLNLFPHVSAKSIKAESSHSAFLTFEQDPLCLVRNEELSLESPKADPDVSEELE
jgi:hypothetical protein